MHMVPRAEEQPVQPPNVPPIGDMALRVTDVPLATLAVHVAPQLMIPAGTLLVTSPPAALMPAFTTVSEEPGGGGGVVNAAVTLAAAFIVTTHAPVPVQAPLHPVNVAPEPAVGVSVTGVPVVKAALQVAPQLIPAGLLATLPLPVTETLSVCVVGGGVPLPLKLTVTVALALSVIVQEPRATVHPLQVPKVEPTSGVAVSLTRVPGAKLPVHVAPHAIPAGTLAMVPLPVPVFTIVSVGLVTGAAVNVAVTLVAALIGTMQDPVPLQAPPQPAKVDPPEGAAVRVTATFAAIIALHVRPQLMPAGLLVTAPVPVPPRVTARV